MALDRDRIRFKGKALSAAIRCGGSIEHDDAGPFFDNLYAEWQGSGLSLDASEGWLDERLKDAFKCVERAPEWVDEEEPLWPFIDGKPMVFLAQCTMKDDELGREELSPGETAYLFGGRKHEDGKVRMTYTTVSQFAPGY